MDVPTSCVRAVASGSKTNSKREDGVKGVEGDGLAFSSAASRYACRLTAYSVALKGMMGDSASLAASSDQTFAIVT